MEHRLLSRQSSCPEAIVATAIHIGLYWISQGGFLSFDRTAPRRIEHATPSLSCRAKGMHSTSFLQQCGRRIHRILTQSTKPIYCICSELQEKVYPSRIANVVTWMSKKASNRRV